MIPLKLKVSGFLSYREPVELDFTLFDLACISGANGAGKSSLLDALTWAVFGQARKRDESVIHLHPDVKAAEVIFIFAYEGNMYRVQRSLSRGKSTLLEFQIYQGEAVNTDINQVERDYYSWRPLTESSVRETQARIERTLRLDYDTFINASFFLQGKADQFTQHRPSERKRILGSILDLEIWEVYKERAAEQRKGIESQVSALQGSLREINAELNEETARKERLEQLQGDLQRLAQARAAQMALLDSLRKVAATLAEQRRLVDALQRQAEASTRRLAELDERLAARQAEQQATAALLARSAEIQAAYQAWQQARQQLEQWEQVAERFRDQEKRRQEPLEAISSARARLQEQVQALRQQEALQAAAGQEIPAISEQLAATRIVLEEIEANLAQRAAVESELRDAQQRLADARAENPRLRAEMDALKERITRLEQLDSAICPFCGQPLPAEQRQRLVAELTEQGVEKGDRYRQNRTLLEQADQLVGSLEARVFSFARLESERLAQTRTLEQAAARLQQVETGQQAWLNEMAPRLADLSAQLAGESFAPEARQRLAEVDAELKAIGYDAAAHDETRRLEAAGRQSEGDLRELEKAAAAQATLERELAGLAAQRWQFAEEQIRQVQEHAEAAAALAQAEAQAPDIFAAERELYALQEQENRLRFEVGAAQQKVLVLDDLKVRKAALLLDQDDLARQVARLKQLERAFGKDGVPALLIEQALPQIEEKANEILDRLSNGGMSVRFVTQAAYKDKRRDDLKETLDIQISDGSGTRDYEMFSGGEAFRVNFAIRLALAEVLAQRAGARLQMLVIDEGFGSQDAEGRQRLIEAINLVRPDFAKILVITHIDELKDAFPARIEVEKTLRGSLLRVV